MTQSNVIEAALSFIPANLPRKEWANVGISLKAGGGSFEEFLKWSQQGSNYTNEKSCLDAWNSFNEGGGINGFYLLKIAKENGYKPPKNQSSKPFHDTPSDWFDSLSKLEKHAYLQAKQLPLSACDNLRTGKDSSGIFIADPLYDLKGSSNAGFNRIYGEGSDNKKLAPKTKKAGNVGMTGTVVNGSDIRLVEGMADRIHAHLKYKAPAFSSNDAGNMVAAFKTIRATYPKNKIFIDADNDKAGLSAALNAIAHDDNSEVQVPLLHKDLSDMVLDGFDHIITFSKKTSYNDAVALMQNSLIDAIDNDATANNSTIELWISAAVNLNMENNAVMQQSLIDAIKKKTRLSKPDIKHTIKAKAQQKRFKALQKKGIDNALVTIDDNGKEKLAAHSQASRILADMSSVIANLRFDGISDSWMGYQSTHWQMLTDADVETYVVNAIEQQAGDIGFNDSYAKGVKTLLKTRVLNSDWNKKQGLISLKNGVFDTSSMQLLPHNKKDYLTSTLPFDYDPKADCPITKQFLFDSVGGDDGQVQILRAFINATIKGRADLQRFLLLIGMGGSGKGTFMRLLVMLVGQDNTHTTNFRNLEGSTGRFDIGKLHLKKLLLIPDADRYAGSVEQFKSITGQDSLRYEEKNKNNKHNGSFTFGGMVAVASNEPLAVKDNTSGFARRILTLNFNNASNTRDGNLSATLESELNGVFNWALGLSDEQVTDYIKNTSKTVASARKLAFENIINMNPLAAWVHDCLVIKSENIIRVGVKKRIKENRENGTSVDVYEHQDEYLFPNYLAWCEANDKRNQSLQVFSGLLKQLFESPDLLNIPTSLVYKPINSGANGSHFIGLDIRPINDTEALSPLDVAATNEENSQKENSEEKTGVI